MNVKKPFHLVGLLALAMLAACASPALRPPADNLVSPNFHHPQSASLIVLLPAEIETIDLEPGVAILMKALHQKLTAAGYKVVALDQGSHDAIWSQEVAAAGGIYDSQTGALRQREMLVALGHLAQRVSAETQATMLIRPRFVLRNAEISGMSATWDGQQRRVTMTGAGGYTITHSGETLGLSVGLDMISPSGELLMQTHGGALLPYRPNFQTGKNEVRADLFANEQEVADGVVIALSPFLKQ